MPRLQQLRGRIRRVGEGVSSIWTISCQVRLLSVPEHATLETLHFPLMKIRRIKFGGGQAFQHKRTHLAEVSAAWIGFFGKHEGL